MEQLIELLKQDNIKILYEELIHYQITLWNIWFIIFITLLLIVIFLGNHLISKLKYKCDKEPARLFQIMGIVLFTGLTIVALIYTIQWYCIPETTVIRYLMGTM